MADQRAQHEPNSMTVDEIYVQLRNDFLELNRRAHDLNVVKAAQAGAFVTLEREHRRLVARERAVREREEGDRDDRTIIENKCQELLMANGNLRWELNYLRRVRGESEAASSPQQTVEEESSGLDASTSDIQPTPAERVKEMIAGLTTLDGTPLTATQRARAESAISNGTIDCWYTPMEKSSVRSATHSDPSLPTFGPRIKLERRSPTDEELQGREMARGEAAAVETASPKKTSPKKTRDTKEDIMSGASVFRRSQSPVKSPNPSSFTHAQIATGSPTLKVVIKSTSQRDMQKKAQMQSGRSTPRTVIADEDLAEMAATLASVEDTPEEDAAKKCEEIMESVFKD